MKFSEQWLREWVDPPVSTAVRWFSTLLNPISPARLTESTSSAPVTT